MLRALRLDRSPISPQRSVPEVRSACRVATREEGTAAVTEFIDTEKQRLLHALFPDQYENPDGPNCELIETDTGTICVAGGDHIPRCYLCDPEGQPDNPDRRAQWEEACANCDAAHWANPVAIAITPDS